MGTRFMATQEAPIHPRVKEWLIQAIERDTMVILRSLCNSVRVLRNPVAERVAEMEKQGATVEEMAPLISGQEGKELLETGEGAGLQACGQVVGLIHDIPSSLQPHLRSARCKVKLAGCRIIRGGSPLRRPSLFALFPVSESDPFPEFTPGLGFPFSGYGPIFLKGGPDPESARPAPEAGPHPSTCHTPYIL